MLPINPWDMEFSMRMSPVPPILTISSAEIVTLSNPDIDLPFVKSALRLLLPKVKLTMPGSNAIRPNQNPIAIPDVMGGMENILKVYDARALSVSEYRTLEASGAIVALYSLTIAAGHEYKSLHQDANPAVGRFVTLELNIFQRSGTFEVQLEHTDNILNKMVRTFPANTRCAVAFHDTKRRHNLIGVPFKQPEKPKRVRKPTTRTQLRLVGT